MIEVMAAMAVLAVLVTAASVLLVKSLAVTGSDRQRVRAANLAAQEVDRVRGLMQTDPSAVSTQSPTDLIHTVANLTSTLFTVTSTQTVGATVFKLVDSGTWQSASSYNGLDLTVNVSWPNMAGVKPVINSAVLTIEGTGGNGSNGNIVSVSTAPTSSPIPTATLSPSCSLQTGTTSVVVDSTVTAPGGTYTGLWDGGATILGTVYATATGSNPCGTATVPLLYSGASGIYSVSLPYGAWILTAKLNDGAVLTEPVTVGATAVTAPTLAVTDNCGGTASVQYLVQTQNSLLSWLLTPIVGATVTGARAATSTCSTPVTTTFSSGLLGLFTGSTAYGNWTFASTSPLVSASATVGSGTSSVTLTGSDSSCPTNLAPVTVNFSTSTGGTGTGYNGTVTATRTASGACGTEAVPLTLVNGTATKTLDYGTWTFSALGASATKQVLTNSAVTASLGTLNICSASVPVTFSLTDENFTLLGSYTVRATSSLGSCDTTVTNVLGIGLTGSRNLAATSWTFSLTAPSNRSIDAAKSDGLTQSLVSSTGLTEHISVK
jgi:Tfp pilus assembly protein PilV